uniref:Secreted protein n=1 Tax=Thermosporothrix sp. COM3 TaxID=2490863 RepID=A0A455SYE2_9CHLR|nr:hypothetical protein KTC_48600 [Thermosporothrix sp. COM3]BBH90174.1 hypothetical protein KTC_49250 [Thermosporothrix sp. COM3]BBH90239.1 hypothetical protein KTC_49900 [Thermosporothrix sp. COM3]
MLFFFCHSFLLCALFRANAWYAGCSPSEVRKAKVSGTVATQWDVWDMAVEAVQDLKVLACSTNQGQVAVSEEGGC